MLDAGGDVAWCAARPWRVGIRHPHDRTALAAMLTLADGRRRHVRRLRAREHILDPHTGRAAARRACRSPSSGPTSPTADAYATAAFAMGEAGPRWTAGLRGYEAMTILAGDRVLTTPGFDALTAA